jgi:hypothetical protein
MSSNRSSAAAMRARLNHPVIDSDGHWVEFGPQVADYLRQVGGAKAVEGFKSRPTEDWHLTVPLKERRERRLDQPVWWGMPAKNTLDHATSMLPSCYVSGSTISASTSWCCIRRWACAFLSLWTWSGHWDSKW